MVSCSDTARYRWFDANGQTPLFEFGAGLSYTSFSFTKLNITDNPPTISCCVTNTGELAGSEVVQLYLGFPAPAGEPPRLLKGFEKVALVPRQTATVHFTLTPRDLSVYDTLTHAWTLQTGNFTVEIGSSSRLLPLHGSLVVVDFGQMQ